MNYDDCPKCKTKLEGAKLSCASCGWSKRKERQSYHQAEEGAAAWPSNCEYTDGFLTCRYPAVFTPSTRGGGPYYCSHHARSQGKLIDSLACQKSQSFTAKTFEQQEAEFDRIVAADLQSRALSQKPNESKQQWIERQRAFCRTGARQLAASRPGKQWAYNVLDRYADDKPISHYALKCACESLGMNVEELIESRRVTKAQQGLINYATEAA